MKGGQIQSEILRIEGGLKHILTYLTQKEKLGNYQFFFRRGDFIKLRTIGINIIDH